MDKMREVVQIWSMIYENSYSILLNIIGGIIFAKLVYRNMMKTSQRETAESYNVEEEINTSDVSKKSIRINELTHKDTIHPASGESLKFYRNIFRIIKLKLFFMGGIVFFLITGYLPVYLNIDTAKEYSPLISAGLFTLFIFVLLIIYIKHVRGIKNISKTLVVLRVFGSRSNTQFLFNRIVHLWNYLGATFTIMDPVYARSEFTIIGSPKNFKLKFSQIASVIPGTVFVFYYSFNNALYETLFVNISTLTIFMILLYLIADSFFIKNSNSLLKKVHDDSNFSKTWNGTSRQVNLYCFDNIWKKALREMLGRADIVIMDLRGFTYERKGCAFEISHLVNNFDLDKVLFLTNQKSDMNLIRETLQHEADKIRSDSPNAGKETLDVTIYACEKQNRKETEQIIQILCSKLTGHAGNIVEEPAYSYKTPIPLITIPQFIFMPVLYAIVVIYITIPLIGGSYLISKTIQENNYMQSQDIIAAPPPEPLMLYLLPTFSKATADMEPHFIKITIALGYESDPILNNELEIRKDEIRHMVNIILQGKRYEDLDSVSETVSLAEEIKAHINIRLINGKIKEVYFKEFILN